VQGLKNWVELTRPFSWTASIVPVLVGTALAWTEGHFQPGLFLLTLVGSVLIQVGTNITNEIFDVKRGIDVLEKPTASKVILEGRIAPRTAHIAALGFLLVALGIGVYLSTVAGPVILVLALIGVLSGYFYTAEPLSLKYRALGVPLVFLTMGVLIVIGAYYVQTQTVDPAVVLLSLPVGFLVAAILHANDLRDIGDDSKVGTKTLSILIGAGPAAVVYYTLIVGAYLIVLWSVSLGQATPWSLIVLLSIPGALGVLGKVRRGTDPENLAIIDILTAKLHLQFGVLLTLGLLIGGWMS